MKFEYDNKERDDECVAYTYKTRGGEIALAIKCVDDYMICMYEGGDTRVFEETYFDIEIERDNPIHKFYPGDKITITF